MVGRRYFQLFRTISNQCYSKYLSVIYFTSRSINSTWNRCLATADHRANQLSSAGTNSSQSEGSASHYKSARHLKQTMHVGDIEIKVFYRTPTYRYGRFQKRVGQCQHGFRHTKQDHYGSRQSWDNPKVENICSHFNYRGMSWTSNENNITGYITWGGGIMGIGK